MVVKILAIISHFIQINQIKYRASGVVHNYQ